eukprot:8677779-Ditylum_brightwellii.AAC.1
MAMDTMATTTTTSTSMTTPKHQNSCPGVGNANVPITLFKNEKTGRSISGETSNTRQTCSKRQYLSPDMSSVTRQDDDGICSFQAARI